MAKIQKLENLKHAVCVQTSVAKKFAQNFINSKINDLIQKNRKM